MKRTVLVFAVVALSTYVFAQDSFLSISMGASIPLGDYSTTDKVLGSGYAGTNFVLNFDGSYILVPFFGIGGTFSFGSNYTESDKLKNQVIDIFRDLYPTFPIPEDSEVDVSLGPWRYVNLMVGPQLSFPIAIIQLDLRTLGGVSFVMPPDRDLSITTPDGDYTSSQKGQLMNFGYLVGGGIRFGMRGATSIRMSADYYHSKPSLEIKNVFLRDNDIEIQEYDMDLNTLHITLGLAFNF
jgi:hypothetical protein